MLGQPALHCKAAVPAPATLFEEQIWRQKYEDRMGGVRVAALQSSGLGGGLGDGLASGDTLGDASGEASGDASGDALGDALGEASGDALGDASGEASGDTTALQACTLPVAFQ